MGRPKNNIDEELEEGHRNCSRCLKVCPESDFHETRRVCKSCIKIKNQLYYANKAKQS